MAILGTKEWAPEKNNCIKGCSNDCIYCFAGGISDRTKKIKREDWHIENPNLNAKPKKHKGRLMFPTSHDLHYKTIGMWGKHLNALISMGNEILIVSKPEWDAISYIIDHYKDTVYKDNIEFRFTIGTDDEEARRFWEPNAPSISERIRCLKYAYQNNYKTSVSMEPLLIPDPFDLIKKLDPYVNGEIWIGLMNYIRESWFKPHEMRYYRYQTYINSYDNILKVYNNTKDNPKIRYKDSIRDLLNLVE